ncbi:MAG: DUF2628 domain-containing protein [Gracilibacteraceae bacterium]|jgi:hypothetical protein|nr:DUF2628 domain-containing protein [Gracilibacteraceae bacterium]
MDCPNCGAANSDERKYCAACDTELIAPEGMDNSACPDPLPTPSEKESDDQSADWEADMEAFIAKRQSYYMDKFEYMGWRNKLTWNWPAFFLGTVWLIYRKMYKYTLIFTAISYILGRFLPANFAGGMFILPVVLGLSANYLYMLHVQAKLRAARATGDRQEKALYIKNHGGVNLWGALILFGLLLVFLYFTMQTIVVDPAGRNVFM